MRYIIALLFLSCSLTAFSQPEGVKPPYCEEGPNVYGNVAALPGGSPVTPLPRFTTTPIKEYKIQVAILKYTDPSEYPFHPSLVARYRPCEQVWVVESRKSFANRADAVALQNELKALGYDGAYITDLIAYQ